MLLRSFAAALLLSSTVGLAACAADAPSAQAGDEQDITQTELANVKVESKKLVWGRDANYGGDPQAMRDVHAFLFDGEAGDLVVAQSSADKPGTLFILAQTATGFTTLAKTAVSGVQGETKATLTKKGTYALAYQARIGDAKPDPNALFPESFSASLKLTGTPTSPAAKTALKIRQTWEESTDFSETEKLLVRIDEKKLPPTALAQWKKLNTAYGSEQAPTASTWDIDGVTVYVVESYHDVDWELFCYDAQGKLLAQGAAAEGIEVYWKD